MEKQDITFPTLPAKDLATIVTSWDFTHISEEDLIKPSASLVQSIYCTLLAQIMGIEMGHLEGHRDALLEGVEFRVR